MVEEMYMEEMKEQEQNGSEDKTCHSEQNEDTTSKSNMQDGNPSSDDPNRRFKQAAMVKQNVTSAVSNPAAANSPVGINIQNQSCFNLIGLSGMESITQGSPKKSRNTEMMHSPGRVLAMQICGNPCEENNEQDSMKYGNERQNKDEFTNFMGGFESYPLAEIGGFSAEQFAAPYSGNGVSLTLGLPHCKNLSMSGAHQTFLPNQNIQLGRGIEVVEANDFSSPMSSYSTNVYEKINIQNRKRFAVQLLPDFVVG